MQIKLRIVKLIAFGAFILIMLSCTLRKSPKELNKIPNLTQDSFVLVWNDEFEEEGLPDASKWAYDTEGNEKRWGNNEEQYYTVAKHSNAKVKNGVLNITAVREDHEGRPFTSARLVSKQGWQKGKFIIRARVPAGRGTWSAIWMMPEGWTFNDGNWPDVGEFDIMEHVGHESGKIHASAHSRDFQWRKGTQRTNTIMIPDATTAFHDYTWEWTDDHVRAFVDNELYFEYQNSDFGNDKWPYHKAFSLILNVAVGGDWGAEKGIDHNAFPQTMEIDYVRVYKNLNEIEK